MVSIAGMVLYKFLKAPAGDTHLYFARQLFFNVCLINMHVIHTWGFTSKS